MRTNKNCWYIIRSQSNRERSICEKIKKESETGDLMGKVKQVVVPVENYYYIKDKKKMKREKVMYPGYIFVETNSPGSIKEYLKNITGASGFLKSRSGEIQELSEKEVNRMLGVQEELNSKDISNPFIVDEEVLITDGPFASMKGVIGEINGENIKVTVSIFGRITLIELKVDQISKP